MKMFPVLILLLLTSCTVAPTPWSNSVYVPPPTPLEKYPIEVKAADKSNLPILITWMEVSKPNSAGSISVRIEFVSLTYSPIKYVLFHVIPYNKVKDKVASEISGKVDAYLNGTGPYPRGTPEGSSSWENVWYNSTIECAVIEDIKITLMDGTIKTYSGKDFEDIFSNKYIKEKQKSCRS